MRKAEVGWLGSLGPPPTLWERKIPGQSIVIMLAEAESRRGFAYIGSTVLDEVLDQNAPSDSPLLQRYNTAADFLGRNLRLVDRNDRRRNSNTKTCNTQCQLQHSNLGCEMYHSVGRYGRGVVVNTRKAYHMFNEVPARFEQSLSEPGTVAQPSPTRIPTPRNSTVKTHQQ